jgi:predicted alpha-1,2-mannosidase
MILLSNFEAYAVNSIKNYLCKQKINSFLLIFLLMSCSNTLKTSNPGLIQNPVDYVNVFIDSHDSRWFYFSSASRPFGMVNLSPDTHTQSSWNSGYRYGSEYIRCFSHIHGWQLSGIAVMPVTGKMNGHLGMDVYRSRFTHDGEIAMPGYHNIQLDDYDVQVELTSTTRVGLHRYLFTNDEERHVLFDIGAYLAHGPTIDTYIRKVSDTSIEGYQVFERGRFRRKPLTVYFVADFDMSFTASGFWQNGKLIKGSSELIKGAGTGAYFTFPCHLEELQLKVAISYTSIENARYNMDTELAHWDFERIRQDSYDEWNEWLSRIQVQGGTRQQQVKFYTDLWRALQGRRIMSDANGFYIDNTGPEPVIRRVQMKDGKPVFPHYNFDSLWFSHWSINILWSMVYPELMDGFCNTMVDMYKNGGLIPRGPSGGMYTYIMVGDANAFFATAYNKGIRNYDAELAFEGCFKNSSIVGIRDSAVAPGYGNLGGMQFYLDRGYIPEHNTTRGATMTLDYTYMDWSLAQMAKNMGKEKEYSLLMERARNYLYLANPETGMIHPRELDGSWIEDLIPVAEEHRMRGFVEGNAPMYTMFVPHDMSGLANSLGGYDAFNERVNGWFQKAKPGGFVGTQKRTHASNWVNYGNEVGHGTAHVFNHTRAPWLSQKWVREVKEALNDTTAYGGYNGDEDQGKGGSVGVLMAIGLFSYDGGASVKPFYEITSPIFDKVVIKLNNKYYFGEEFVIETKNNSSENMYIKSAKLNGKKLDDCWFYHDTFANGGKLELRLGNKPNKKWGAENPPPSMSREKKQ